jgi:Tol biopolymer transport system component/DNA-binding winged helix-turn-helix (wHTH) protein
MLNFGPFTIDLSERELRRDGAAVALPPKVFDLLALLVGRAGKLVTKDDLMRELWPDSFVDEANLTQNVFTLRRALGDGDGGTKYIETVPRRGYRFVAPLTAAPPAAGHQAPAPPVAPPVSRRRVLAPAALVVAVALVVTGLVWRWGRAPGLPFERLEVRALTTTGDILDAAMSPDGRFIAYVRGADARWTLWLHQVATGEVVQIGQDEPAPVDSLTFSADGERLYFVRHTAEGNSVHAIGTLGGASRHVVDGTSSPVAVSPDGSRIAFVRWHPTTGERHLVVADAFGGHPRTVLVRHTPEVIVYQGAGWSPDGARLAVVVNESFGGRVPRLIVVDVDSGRETTVTGDLPWNAGKVVWLPDGRHLLVAAGKLYRVSYPDGVVSRVTHETANYTHLSIAASGQTVMAVQRNETSAIWTADDGDFDRAREVWREAGYNHALAWLPGSRLIFESTASGNSDLWLSTLDGRPATRLTTEPMPDGFPETGPDQVLVYATSRAGGSTIWRRDLDGRNERQISADGVQYAPDRSPDGQHVVFHRAHPSKSWTVWRVALDGSGLTEITTQPSTFPTYSPDGRFIACNYLRAGASEPGWSIAILPAAGGDPVLLIDEPGPPTRRLEWSPDGRSLYVSAVGDGISKLAVSAGAKAERVAHFPGQSVLVGRWSPDGQRLAYVRYARQDNVVLITARN